MKKTYIGWNLPLIKNFNKLLLIMKLSSIFIFIIVFQATATIYSQKLSVNMENQSLRDVLKTIESESSYRFFYNDQLSGLNQKVTLKAENQTIRELLDQLLANHQFSYKILENNMVVVAPKEFIQQQQVTGKIIDEDGTGLPGVNVVEKGTTNATGQVIENRVAMVGIHAYGYNDLTEAAINMYKASIEWILENN